jgi:hypothetical protein
MPLRSPKDKHLFAYVVHKRENRTTKTNNFGLKTKILIILLTLTKIFGIILLTRRMICAKYWNSVPVVAAILKSHV